MIGSVICVVVLLVACASTPAVPPADVENRDVELDRIRAAVQKALPPGVCLLAAHREGDSIVLNVSEQLLVVTRGAEVEDVLHRMLTAASAARTSRPRIEDYRILVNGVPFEQQIR